jgi:hypothetical protein
MDLRTLTTEADWIDAEQRFNRVKEIISLICAVFQQPIEERHSDFYYLLHISLIHKIQENIRRV